MYTVRYSTGIASSLNNTNFKILLILQSFKHILAHVNNCFFYLKVEVITMIFMEATTAKICSLNFLQGKKNTQPTFPATIEHAPESKQGKKQKKKTLLSCPRFFTILHTVEPCRLSLFACSLTASPEVRGSWSRYRWPPRGRQSCCWPPLLLLFAAGPPLPWGCGTVAIFVGRENRRFKNGECHTVELGCGCQEYNFS